MPLLVPPFQILPDIFIGDLHYFFFIERTASPSPGNFRTTAASTFAFNAGLANCVARAFALIAWLRSGIGYDRLGPANVFAGNALRLAAVSFAIHHPSSIITALDFLGKFFVPTANDASGTGRTCRESLLGPDYWTPL